MEYHNETNNQKKLFLFLTRFSSKRYIFAHYYMLMYVSTYKLEASQYTSISNSIYDAINI